MKNKIERRASDNLCKNLAEQYPEQFIAWLFGTPAGEVQIVKTELNREPIRADAALLVESGGVLYHIEFQTTARSETPLPLRMLDYYVGFKRNFPDKIVRQALVILQDSGITVPGQYQDESAFLRYNVVRLWETNPQDLWEHEGLLPLAVLCRADDAPLHLLELVAERIATTGDIAERREKTAMTRVLAGLRFPLKLVSEILLETEMLEESVVYQDILQRGVQRGVQQGVQQGLEQGERRGEQKIILQQLSYRFGRVDKRLEQRIGKLSTERIEELGRMLFELRDLDDLRNWLKTRAR